MSTLVVPDDWTQSTLCEVLVNSHGGAWGSESELPNAGVIRTTNISDKHELDLTKVAWRTIPDKQLIKQTLHDGDIVMTKSNSIERVGSCALFKTPQGDKNTYIAANFCQRLSFDDSKIIPEYGYYWLISKSIQTLLKSQATGTSSSLQNINGSKIAAIPIAFPNVIEQRRIIDRVQECIERVHEIQSLKIQSETDRGFLLESVVESALTNATGEEVSLNDVCEITSKLIDPRETQYKDLLHIGGANIESKTSRLIDLKTAKDEKLKSGKFLFNDSTVLYNKIRPYLVKVARPDFSGLCSADMYPLTPNTDRITRDFLFYALMSRHFTHYAIAGSNRAGMPKVNRNHLFGYELTLPTIEEQNNITSSLDSAFSAIEEMRTEMADAYTDMSALRDSVLRKAFSGEL